VVGLIPATVDDAATAKLSKSVVIDVAANDLFAKGGFFSARKRGFGISARF
jgi:hypothetical protein